jgi:hypothetical protein
MHFECHAILGWAIGNLGKGDRRARAWCTAAAVLPDIDAIPFLFGPRAYELYHHTFGHNVFLWALVTAWVAARIKNVRTTALVFLSFGTHLLTDAYFSAWPLYLWWPFSRQGYVFPNAIELHHPANMALLYIGFALVILIAFACKRTPLEFFSEQLDRVVIMSLRRPLSSCAICGKGTNHQCHECGLPICVRHSVIARGWSLRCAQCQVVREENQDSPDP